MDKAESEAKLHCDRYQVVNSSVKPHLVTKDRKTTVEFSQETLSQACDRSVKHLRRPILELAKRIRENIDGSS